MEIFLIFYKSIIFVKKWRLLWRKYIIWEWLIVICWNGKMRECISFCCFGVCVRWGNFLLFVSWGRFLSILWRWILSGIKRLFWCLLVIWNWKRLFCVLWFFMVYLLCWVKCFCFWMRFRFVCLWYIVFGFFMRIIWSFMLW